MLTTNYENKYALYELKETYLLITYKKGKYIDYKAACTIVNDRLRIQSYKTFAIICDLSHLEGISTDARDYLAHFGSTLIKTVALVSTTSSIKHMARYFVIINKPKIPTKVFDQLADAELYIKTQL